MSHSVKLEDTISYYLEKECNSTIVKDDKNNDDDSYLLTFFNEFIDEYDQQNLDDEDVQCIVSDQLELLNCSTIYEYCFSQDEDNYSMEEVYVLSNDKIEKVTLKDLQKMKRIKFTVSIMKRRSSKNNLRKSISTSMIIISSDDDSFSDNDNSFNYNEEEEGEEEDNNNDNFSEEEEEQSSENDENKKFNIMIGKNIVELGVLTSKTNFNTKGNFLCQ